ncbi:type VII secretion integral membrane protein EccD [Mycolicibacterium baixiangningiae]|uniref:type VII secretion integral membrane protein EccD n=1 Tax=Mycolicibacterium baixiangningiae TaxID=2761578 RepID=UPI001867FE7D|nr:type VII secretion integral membrane protein EccD [Mycolicibacterium baixiangningiae]
MTELAAPRTDLDSTGHEAMSPLPELVRVAVVGQHRQLDLSLPLDVPVALLVPEVVRLFDGAEDLPKDVVWGLVGAESGALLAPDDTLRGAAVSQDDVLYLRGRRTLAIPTLYDDVVDAAAHLNQSGHPGWDPAAAGRIAYLGVCLAAAAWVYLVLVDASSPRRAALLGLSAFVAVTLLVVAAIFPRSGGSPQSGAVLGWACLPIAAAGCWAGLSPYGSLALAGGALALILLCVAGYRLVGAGAGGFTAAGVFFACGAIASVIHAAGVTGFGAAVWLAVGATVATLAVPRLTARLDYSRPARPDPTDGQESTGTAPPPGGEDVGRQVTRARSLRAGLYAGLAVGACFGGAAVAWAGPTPSWPALTFGLVCAAALGLPRPGARTGLARAALGLPAVALVVAVAFAAVRGDEPTSVAGASALLACAIVLAAVGAGSGSARRRPRWRALLSLCSYLAFGLVVPSALWAVGGYASWGVG